jgi:SnoaL-like domain
MTRATPVEVVTEYYEYVWTGRDIDRVRKLCADPVLRHDPGGDYELSHDDQIARIEGALKKGLQYHFPLRTGNDDYATFVWQAVSSVDPDLTLTGVQVLKVVEGRIVEVWNATKPELWVPQDVKK